MTPHLLGISSVAKQNESRIVRQNFLMKQSSWHAKHTGSMGMHMEPTTVANCIAICFCNIQVVY